MTAEVLDRFEDLARVDPRRPGRVHIGDDGGHPQCGGEEGEEGERGQVDFARFDGVEPLQHFDLRLEDAVRVDDPLGGPGAAAGEEEGGRLVGGGIGPGESGFRYVGFPQAAQVVLG